MEEVFDEFEQAGGIKVPKKITVNQARQDVRRNDDHGIQDQFRNQERRHQQETMKAALLLCALSVALPVARTETSQERGKHVIDEAVTALGGERYLQMQDRIESGRAYSFYREELNGLSIAKIYTRYLTRPEPPVPDFLGLRERQSVSGKRG